MPSKCRLCPFSDELSCSEPSTIIMIDKVVQMPISLTAWSFDKLTVKRLVIFCYQHSRKCIIKVCNTDSGRIGIQHRYIVDRLALNSWRTQDDLEFGSQNCVGRDL